VYLSDAKNTNNLAYIATTANNIGSLQQQQMTTLNLKSLDSPTTSFTSKSITGAGILAVGGNNSNSLYHIQSNYIEHYRLDTMDYSQTQANNLNLSNNLEPGTIGQVFIPQQNSTAREFISVYYQENAEIDIFNHDFSQSSYTHLTTSANGYINFGNNDISTVTTTDDTSKGNSAGSNSQGSTTSSNSADSSSISTSATTTSKPSNTKFNHSSSTPTTGKYHNCI
jgi:hypothetical protein